MYCHVNHQGNREQLEEVWKEEDSMETEKFDPNAFFMLHGMCV